MIKNSLPNKWLILASGRIRCRNVGKVILVHSPDTGRRADGRQTPIGCNGWGLTLSKCREKALEVFSREYAGLWPTHSPLHLAGCLWSNMGEIWFSVSWFDGGWWTFNLQIDDLPISRFILYYCRVKNADDIWMPKASVCLDLPHRFFDTFLTRRY